MEKLPHQEYRDNLAEILDEASKEDAKDFIQQERETDEYKNAKKLHLEEAGKYRELRELKRKKREELDAILNQSLTVENILGFADKYLNEIITFVQGLLHEYKNNPILNGDSKLNTQEQEDAVCKVLDLPNIPQIIDQIVELKEQIEDIKSYADIVVNKTNRVITPSGEGYIETGNQITSYRDESAEFEKGKTPHLLTLLYILKSDFNIDIKDQKEVQILEGAVGKNSVRREPYFRIIIPSINRVVYLCDEVGNVSFVFDINKLGEAEISIDSLDVDNKIDKSDLIYKHKGIGARLKHKNSWRDDMGDLLTKDFNETEGPSFVRVAESIPYVSKNELDKWRGFYTDEDGKHWGPKRQLCIKFGIYETALNSAIVNGKSTEILDLYNRVTRGYCYEDLLESSGMKRFIELPKALKQGEWRGFVEMNGLHYGPLGTTYTYSGMGIGELERVVENNSEVRSLKVLDVMNKSVTAYCYEDLKPFIDSFQSIPAVSETGEYSGFYEKDGEHIGSIGAIAKRLGVAERFVDIIAKDNNLSSTQIRGAGGMRRNGYSLEKIAGTKEHQEYIVLSKVEQEGEWKGFVIKDGKHWGAWMNVNSRLGIISGGVVGRMRTEYLKTNPPVIKAIDLADHVNNLVAIEDVEIFLNNRKIRRVRKQFN